MMEMRKRNGLVECLRLLFTAYVLLVHSTYVSHGEEALFKGGWLGVEFFFLLSGYLMAREEAQLPAGGELGVDTARFMAKKIRRLFPYLAFAIVVNFAVWSIPFSRFTVQYAERAMSGLLNFIFAYSAGFPGDEFFYLGYSWYISAMVLSMLFLFPLLHRNRKTFYGVYAPIIILFGMGLFAFKYGRLGYVTSDDWVLSNGVLRASFELCLGCLCYIASEKLKTCRFTKTGARLLSVLLLLGTAAVSVRIIFLGEASILDFLLIFPLAVIVIIAFSEKSSISFSMGGWYQQIFGEFQLRALYHVKLLELSRRSPVPGLELWKGAGGIHRAGSPVRARLHGDLRVDRQAVPEVPGKDYEKHCDSMMLNRRFTICGM